MVERDIGELIAQHASDGRAPEPRSFENVRFVHGRQLAPPGARELGGYARHALDLESRVHTLVDRALATGHLFAALVAEIHTTRELAHEDEVHPFQPLRAQWRRSSERWMHRHGSQIGVHLQLSTQTE